LHQEEAAIKKQVKFPHAVFQPYFGSKWGENGRARIKLTPDTCGITLKALSLSAATTVE
jgi:hypothetical protein